MPLGEPTHRRLGAILSGLLAATCSSAHAALPSGPGNHIGTIFCHAHGQRRGGVVVIHGGGFYLPGATVSFLRASCATFTAAGFDVAAVGYPLHTYRGALAASRHALRALRRREGKLPVFAYGESVGGNLAIQLDRRPGLAGAVAVAAPTDLLTWMKGTSYYRTVVPMTIAQRVAGSPLLLSAPRAPLLLEASPDDTVVPFSQSADLAARVGATVSILTGDHVADPSAAPRAAHWMRELLAT